MVTVDEFLSEWHNGNECMLVHTSGSTGEPKPLWVEKRRMEASARITCKFLNLQAGDTALLCLPLDYIAGKMMVVRALTCGLRLFSVPPSSHPLSNDSISSAVAAADSSLSTIHFPLSFAAMVPMQVYNSLQVPEERERLRQIRHLIIGGGAINDALSAELKDFPNAIWSTYGMTETLSHIALRRLNGPDASDWYIPFDGVTLSLDPDGCLVIDASLVCPQVLVTNDIAKLRPDGRFRILGRRDNVVCSGGIKIQIEEVERLLTAHLHVPFVATKRPDEQLGEALVLLTESVDTAAIQAICRQVLPPYWQPRHYLHIDHIPVTETGKPARHRAAQLASSRHETQ
jgi:O-succinylbenzoic acid--CoA ligase